MRIRRARQILKSFADDTRLRIINLLSKEELNVTELCKILSSTQSNISKHLARLRLTGLVSDRRKGLNVYYYLRHSDRKSHNDIVKAIVTGFSELDAFKKDLAKLKKLKRKNRS